MALCDEWAAILIVFCRCLLLIAISTIFRLEHDKKKARKVILIYIWMKAWNRSGLVPVLAAKVTFTSGPD